MSRILYRIIAMLARLAVRSGRGKDLEIIVLRHQLTVLRRQIDRPAVSDADRTLLGAIAAGILGTLLLFAAHPVRKTWLYLLAIALPWLVSLLFIHVLNVPLPSGTLWN